MRKLLLTLLLVSACYAQTAVFPYALAGSDQLKVAGNRVQSTLTVSVSSSDTAIVLNSGTGWLPGMLASIGSEVISICGVGGNVLLVGTSSTSCPNVNGRGFDGTTASAHLAAACNATVSTGCVSNYVAGWYENSRAAEIEAIEATLGANLANVQSVIPFTLSTEYWRGDHVWAPLNTSAVPEASNLYYTDARVLAAVTGQFEPAITGNTAAKVWNGLKAWETLDTSIVPENGNLYFTTARAQGALSATSPISYNSSTGVISCPTCGSGGTTSFSGLTGGTNTAALIMGSGGSLTYSGGTIDASLWVGISILPPTTANQVILSRTSSTAVWMGQSASAPMPECPDSAQHLNFTGAAGFTCGTTGGSTASVAWSGVTPGTNTQGAFHFGTGGSLDATGYGTITATALAPGSAWTGTLTGANLVLAGSFKTAITGTSPDFQCLHANYLGVVTGTGLDCGSGGSGGYGIVYSFNPNTTSTLTCSSPVDSSFTASTTLTGAASISSVTCPPPSGGYIELSFTFSQGSTVYAATLPSPFNQCPWALMAANSSETESGKWDGTTYYDISCSSTGGTTYIPTDLTVTGNITTNIAGLVQCVHVNAYGVLSGTGYDCGSGGGGGTPGGTNGQFQYNSGGVFAGFTAHGDLTVDTSASPPGLFTLSNVNSNVGDCGDSSHFAVPTFNAKGLATGCTAYSSGSSGNPFAGSVTANTALTNGAGFYIGSTGVIEWNTSLSQVNILDVFNITATGDISTSGVHRVVAGNGSPGGYWLGSTQVMAGNGATTLTAAAYVVPLTVNGYNGGSANLFEVWSFIGGGRPFAISSSGASLFLPFHDVVPVTIDGCSGCGSDILDVYTYNGGTKVLSVSSIGGVSIANTGALFTVYQQSIYGRVVNFEPSYQDEQAAIFYGYTGGSQDVVDVYNQGGGSKMFGIAHTGGVFIGAGEIVNYGSYATQGQGVPPIYAAISLTGQTGSIGATSLKCGGATCPAGLYRVSVYSSLISGSGSLSVTLTWHDGNVGGGAQAVFPVFPFASISEVLYTSGTNDFTVATTDTGITYSIWATLERLQ